MVPTGCTGCFVISERESQKTVRAARLGAPKEGRREANWGRSAVWVSVSAVVNRVDAMRVSSLADYITVFAESPTGVRI